MLIGLAAFVAAPLYRPRLPSAGDPGRTASLVARRDALLRALRDLEADRRSGLVDPEVYEAQRTPLESEAASVLRALEMGEATDVRS